MAAASTTTSIINNWLKKGDKEKDNFNKFLCYWISFNCYYTSITGNPYDKQALDALKLYQPIEEPFKIMIEKHMIFFQNLLSVCPILDERINPKPPLNFNEITISNTIDILYRVRCNLFHGNKDINDKRDIEVISVALPVLEMIAKTFNEI
ncbi:MAG: hypothetical protein CFE24_15060 [Flavobacterium sp. BFFFF2]|nr:MAG: hypothetical protein CFE24_15060 [Flavobacterium sp. BFFFF2]